MNINIEKKLEDFFNKYKHQAYKRGEIIIRADDNPQGIYYLKHGTIKMYAISRKGEEIVLNIYKPISFFPMTWGLNKTPNIYYFEALESVETYRAPREDVVDFLERNADVTLDLLKRLYKGTDGILTRMTYLMGEDAYARLIVELVIFAKRFGEISKDGSVLLKISERELAGSSGMTRETVSREIKALKEKGLIEFTRNHLKIKNLNKLEEVLLNI